MHFFLFHSPLANHQLHFRKKQSISSAQYAHCIPIQSRLRDFKALIKVQLGVHILSQIRGAGRRERGAKMHSLVRFSFSAVSFSEGDKKCIRMQNSSSSKNATLRFSDTWEFSKKKRAASTEKGVERRNEKQISCTTHIKVSSVLSVKVEREGGLNKDDNPCPVFSSSPHYDPPGWHHIAKSR